MEENIIVNYLGDYFSNNSIYLNSFSIIFTILAVSGLTNAFNFLDGIDGLVIMQSIISLLSIFIFSYLAIGDYFLTNFHISLIIILLVLLFFNLGLISRYKIFLGDSGSLLLGFIISFLLIYYSQVVVIIQYPILVVWIVAFPIIDFISTVARRFLNNRSPFKPDKTHFHHLLLNVGLKKINILFLVSLYSILLSIIGFVITNYFNATLSLLFFLFFCLMHIMMSIRLSNVMK